MATGRRDVTCELCRDFYATWHQPEQHHSRDPTACPTCHHFLGEPHTDAKSRKHVCPSPEQCESIRDCPTQHFYAHGVWKELDKTKKAVVADVVPARKRPRTEAEPDGALMLALTCLADARRLLALDPAAFAQLKLSIQQLDAVD